MRELLFRGKRVEDGKWVYGGFSNFLPNACPLNEIESFVIDWNPESPYKVVPETIGQFIGLKDKFGRKIFEGDIVMYTVPQEDLDEGEEDGKEDYYKIEFSDARFKIAGDEHCIGQDYADEWVVVGNIHDNPEFMP